MPMRNLFRRQTETAAPTLRERAAHLRASLRPSSTAPVAMPAPGSEEAKAAFYTACHEHTIRTQFANEYSDLKRTALEWWTADTLSKAMEAGEITPAECARLYPLATERELRMREIEHELKLGALHALAFADSYPLPPSNDDEATDDAELIRLGHLFEAARVREVAANEAYNAAGREADRLIPPRPACLVYRGSDVHLNVHQERMMAGALDGREIRSADIEWIRRRMPMRHEVLRPIREGERAHTDHPGRKFDIVPHPEAQARAEEIVTAWDAWEAERHRIYNRHVTEALDSAADEAGRATAELAERIAGLPAHTAAGFRVKLQALKHYRREALLAELPALPDPDQILAHSLWRDMHEDTGTAPTPEPRAVDLIAAAGFNLSSLSLRDVAALHDITVTLANVVRAIQMQPRNWRGPHLNDVGHITEWLGDQLDAQIDATVNELRSREPADWIERGIRLEAIAEATVSNGDPEQTTAFARELLATVEA